MSSKDQMRGRSRASPTDWRDSLHSSVMLIEKKTRLQDLQPLPTCATSVCSFVYLFMDFVVLATKQQRRGRFKSKRLATGESTKHLIVTMLQLPSNNFL